MVPAMSFTLSHMTINRFVAPTPPGGPLMFRKTLLLRMVHGPHGHTGRTKPPSPSGLSPQVGVSPPILPKMMAKLCSSSRQASPRPLMPHCYPFFSTVPPPLAVALTGPLRRGTLSEAPSTIPLQSLSQLAIHSMALLR